MKETWSNSKLQMVLVMTGSDAAQKTVRYASDGDHAFTT